MGSVLIPPLLWKNLKVMNKLIIIGASGHGKVIADIAVMNGYKEILFLDDNMSLKECAGFPVVGKVSEISKYQMYDVVVGIGNSKFREEITKRISSYNIVTLIHPNAIISRRVSIGKGTVIMAGAIINSDTKIGESCIINTSSSVDHDCTVNSFSHISVGATIAGSVKIGKHVWIGAGAVVINNIAISDNIYIGAGATVIRNTTEYGTYVGTPSRRIK